MTQTKMYKLDASSWLYNDEYDNIVNHWTKHCGGTVDLHNRLIGDENTLTEFYLTFNDQPHITLKFKEI